MTDIREFCERLWKGEVDTVTEAHPVTTPIANREAQEIADGMLYYKGFAGSTTLDTGDGLVMLDTGARNDSEPLYDAVRRWRPDARLAAAVFSHHHVDHIMGVDRFDQEATDAKHPRPLVYGHELLGGHFDRYKKTTGWNGAINRRQFNVAGLDVERRVPWPEEYRYPDVTYREELTFSQGSYSFELHHARGETEDATWTWVPELKLLAPGDLFVWCCPNAGNPQKVQRWVGDWAAALRRMAALDAEQMIPGHGWPIFGADRVRVSLLDTAELLESMESQVLALMNAGASLDTVLHEVDIPAVTLEKPYLRPVYDHPQFVLRNIWRWYGGWYDGEPDQLLPAPRAEQAREWVAMAGGLEAVLDRARTLAKDGNVRLACHVVEFAVLAEPGSQAAHGARAEIYDARAGQQTSSMARGIFSYAAASSRAGKRDGFGG
ncbi:MAG: alkyl sulfatase dimerization domain-containing protein [Dehalococcoidia bacterium]